MQENNGENSIGGEEEEFSLPEDEAQATSPENDDKKGRKGGKKPVAGAAKQVKYFLLQTFRRRTGGEYSELLTRGVRSTKGVNRAYPWAYFRLFVMLFILYAVFLLIIRFTGNELFGPAVTALAATMFNLPFLLLMFELYPQRDMSFIFVLFVLLVGGTAACVLSQALFATFPSPNEWLAAVYAGFFEELSKAVVTVAAIVMARKNTPLSGFIIGAAIGCGFSIVEDMGYIFVLSNELPALNLTTIISVSFSRGVTAFCTHSIWTALVGWAYCHFKRHMFNALNYVVLAAVCGLHICWDLPLSYVGRIFVCGGCVIASLTAGIVVVVLERKAVFRAAGITKSPQDYFKQDKLTVNERHYLYWKHWGRFTLALGAFLMAAIAVVYCYIPFRETYGTETFDDAESFVEFMQNGEEFDYDPNRPYNTHDLSGNTDEVTVNGTLSQVTQRVVAGGDAFDYVYSVFYDAVDNTFHYMLSQIAVEQVTAEGAHIKYIQESLYNDGRLYATFFRLNSSVTGFNFESDGKITVFIYDASFVRDLGEPRYVALFATFAAVFGASVVCYIGLEIKSRRVKKLCLTENASFAE